MSVHVTGGGVQLLQWLFSVPGASRCIMDASVPYSRSALQSFLSNGQLDPSFITTSCSVTTAEQMARIALKSAAEKYLTETKDFQSLSSSEVLGVACTAALVSSTPKKGSHRCHIAVLSSNGGSTYSLTLNKEIGRSREHEDSICSTLILDSIARRCNLPPEETIAGDLSVIREAFLSSAEERDSQDSIVVTNLPRTDSIAAVCEKRLTHAVFIFKPDVNILEGSFHDRFAVFEEMKFPSGTVVYPGSFNPLHEGHVTLVAAAIRTIQSSSKSPSRPLIVFEIAVTNVDKPALPREEVQRRLLQFDPNHNPLLRQHNLTDFAVVITSEPMFVGKSSLFKGCLFLIGADTFTRLIDTKYYRNKTPPRNINDSNVDKNSIENSALSAQQSLINMIAALLVIRNSGCRFLIGGRVISHKKNETTEPVEDDFETMEKILARSDVSSLLPLEVTEMFLGLKESEFRVDISSTEIRKRNF